MHPFLGPSAGPSPLLVRLYICTLPTPTDLCLISLSASLAHFCSALESSTLGGVGRKVKVRNGDGIRKNESRNGRERVKVKYLSCHGHCKWTALIAALKRNGFLCGDKIFSITIIRLPTANCPFHCDSQLNRSEVWPSPSNVLGQTFGSGSKAVGTSDRFQLFTQRRLNLTISSNLPQRLGSALESHPHPHPHPNSYSYSESIR